MRLSSSRNAARSVMVFAVSGFPVDSAARGGLAAQAATRPARRLARWRVQRSDSPPRSHGPQPLQAATRYDVRPIPVQDRASPSRPARATTPSRTGASRDDTQPYRGHPPISGPSHVGPRARQTTSPSSSSALVRRFTVEPGRPPLADLGLARPPGCATGTAARSAARASPGCHHCRLSCSSADKRAPSQDVPGSCNAASASTGRRQASAKVVRDTSARLPRRLAPCAGTRCPQMTRALPPSWAHGGQFHVGLRRDDLPGRRGSAGAS